MIASKRIAASELDQLLVSTRGSGIGSERFDDAKDSSSSHSLLGASFNVANSIMGAGCIGYGGAMAESGGLISIFLIALFALLTKLSCDLLIDLGLQRQLSSYEQLATASCGKAGNYAVMLSKGLFSFGCMVSYLVILKDNLMTGIAGLLHLTTNPTADNWATIVVSIVAVLPLSLMTDMAPLEKFSGVKVVMYVLIVGIVAYMFFTLPSTPIHSNLENSMSFVQKWLEVKPGVIQSMGTYILAFICQHAIHLVYRSLPQPIAVKWRLLSTIAVSESFLVFIGLAIFPYMTYWENTESDLLQEYPPLAAVDTARILLSLGMVLTFPMPLLSLREIVALCIFEFPDEPLSSGFGRDDEALTKTKLNKITYGPVSHFVLTVLLLAFSLILALVANSLGDILNLNGCISGSLIGFILPAIFSYQLEGRVTILGATLFGTGAFVGVVGTYFTVKTMLIT